MYFYHYFRWNLSETEILKFEDINNLKKDDQVVANFYFLKYFTVISLEQLEKVRQPQQLFFIFCCLSWSVWLFYVAVLIYRPCKEVVLWQPSGVDHLIKETVRPLPGADGDDNFTPTAKSKRKVKIAARTMSPNSSLHLSVPSVRPNTPPPNSKYVSLPQT